MFDTMNDVEIDEVIAAVRQALAALRASSSGLSKPEWALTAAD
jgi:ribosomal protein L12E/L44/L45/RPP1/RPP2